MSKVADVKYLVIDEADRMVEKGHFQELEGLLSLINKCVLNFLLHSIPDNDCWNYRCMMTHKTVVIVFCYMLWYA